MRFRVLKSAGLLLLAGLILGGCATSTVEKRKQERASVYSNLAPDAQSLVDQGKIKIGMPMDAVYIAWGKPSQVLSGESSAGSYTTWLYQGTFLEPYSYWRNSSYRSSDRYYSSPTLEHDYYPRSYVSGEVIFENGLVKQWRLLPQPTY